MYVQEKIQKLECKKCGAPEEDLRYLEREYTERAVLGVFKDGSVKVCSKSTPIGDTKSKDRKFGCSKCKHTWEVPDWAYKQIIFKVG